MDLSQLDMNSLIAQTEAFSWEDPSSQLETLLSEHVPADHLPLVGHVISQKIYNNQAAYASLIKAWPFATLFSFAVLGPNLFLFKFSKQEHITKILDQTTWNVNGSLLTLQKWSPSTTLGELSLKHVPFWIQVHGLPLCNMSTKNAIAIGKGLGHLLKIEDAIGASSTFRSYLRISVEIDSLKPLKPGFSLAKPDGATSWVSLKYERLDAYYTDYGLIGINRSSAKLLKQIGSLPGTKFL
jgi:hypothetical protein